MTYRTEIVMPFDADYTHGFAHYRVLKNTIQCYWLLFSAPNV